MGPPRYKDKDEDGVSEMLVGFVKRPGGGTGTDRSDRGSRRRGARSAGGAGKIVKMTVDDDEDPRRRGRRLK